MATTNSKAQVSLPSDTEVRVTRDFKAPRELIWRAHTEPTLFQRWIGGYPGWSMPVCEMDVRPGGSFLTCIHNPEMNFDCWVKGTYLDVSPP